MADSGPLDDGLLASDIAPDQLPIIAPESRQMVKAAWYHWQDEDGKRVVQRRGPLAQLRVGLT